MQPQNPDNDPYGQQPPPYGSQPPAGDQPPSYGSQPPPYGQQPSYPSGDYSPPPVSGQPYSGGGGYGAPAAPQNNNLGLIALIVGILSIVPLAVCCPLLGVPAGIAAIVLGIQGQKKADQGLASNRGQARAGFITGIVGVVLSIVNFIASLALNFNAPGPGF